MFKDAIGAEKKTSCKKFPCGQVKVCNILFLQWVYLWVKITQEWHLHLVLLDKILNLFGATGQETAPDLHVLYLINHGTSR